MSAVTEELRRAVIVAALLGAASGVLSAQAPGAKDSSRAVPKALAQAGEYAENLYDAAKAQNWTSAGKRLAALQEALKQAGLERGPRAKSEDRLDRNLPALRRSVARRWRRTAMKEANQICLALADLTAGYALMVPVQVARLDFYGRELEIWAEAREASRLRLTANGMRHEWDSVRPAVEERGPAEAMRFGALVARVERARTPAEYGRLAEPVLEGVDDVEKVFGSPGAPPNDR